MNHIISPLDLSVEELDKLLDLANDIERHPEKYAHACEGKRLASLFYEPSPRTRLSFEAAMMNLGGKVLGFSDQDSSSSTDRSNGLMIWFMHYLLIAWSNVIVFIHHIIDGTVFQGSSERIFSKKSPAINHSGA